MDNPLMIHHANIHQKKAGYCFRSVLVLACLYYSCTCYGGSFRLKNKTRPWHGLKTTPAVIDH